MRWIRKSLKILVGLVLALLFLLPVGALVIISKMEQAQYVAAENEQLQDMAYGKVYEVLRMDVEEFIEVSGSVISTKVSFMELKQYKEPYSIRFIVNVGDVVGEGDVIGYYQGKEVYSEVTGQIRMIDLGGEPYIMFESFDHLAIEIACTDEYLLSVFQRSNAELTSADGVIYCVLKVDDASSVMGATKVWIAPEGDSTLIYGALVEDLRLYTGRVFPQSLIIEKTCVYSYPGSEAKYVRTIDRNGVFISEVEVEVGFENGDYVSVSGIEEGTLCDSGYKAIVESGE